MYHPSGICHSFGREKEYKRDEENTCNDSYSFYGEQLYQTFALISLAKTSHMVKPDARCAEFTFPKGGVVNHMTIHWK